MNIIFQRTTRVFLFMSLLSVLLFSVSLLACKSRTMNEASRTLEIVRLKVVPSNETAKATLLRNAGIKYTTKFEVMTNLAFQSANIPA